MPVISYAPAACNLAAWLWRNRRELGNAFSPIADRVESALAMPGEIQRIGSAVVSCRDGQTQVLSLLHHQNAKLDGIAESINELATGQAALGFDLDALRQLSMLALGVSVASLGTAAATIGILLYQSHQLRAHIANLQRQIRRVQDLVVAQQLAQLDAGLAQLQRGVNQIQGGNREQGREEIRFNAANNLAISVNTHANLLSAELRGPKPERAVARELFRHMAVGLMGEVWCHLAQEQHRDAAEAIRLRMRSAELYAREVFNQTVGDQPVRFLCPALGQHGVTIEFLAELFRQASLAGAIDGRPDITASDLIEQWRGRLHTARDPFRRASLDKMRSQLAEAVSAVEEVNRLRGFMLVIDHFESGNVPFGLVMERVRDQTAAFLCQAPPDAHMWLAYVPDPPQTPPKSSSP